MKTKIIKIENKNQTIKKNNYNMDNTFKCSYCNKTYIRKSAYNNHLAKCNFHKLCRTNNEISNNEISNNEISNNETSNNIKNVSLDSISTSNESLFKMIILLHNKYEKLEKDYNLLKTHIYNTKKKIDIISYLNQNYKPSNNFDFLDFTNEINITSKELDLIFKYDYIDGILNIIINAIEILSSQYNILPLKAFNHKEYVLYIYNKNLDSWKIMESNDLTIFIKYFEKKILNLFLEWKTNAEKNMDYDKYTTIYVLNMKKVLGQNFENKDKKTIIKNKLFKHIKVNLKNIVSYEFI